MHCPANHDTRPTKERRHMDMGTGRRDTQKSERPPKLQSNSGKERHQGRDSGTKVESVPLSNGTIAQAGCGEPLLTSLHTQFYSSDLVPKGCYSQLSCVICINSLGSKCCSQLDVLKLSSRPLEYV